MTQQMNLVGKPSSPLFFLSVILHSNIWAISQEYDPA